MGVIFVSFFTLFDYLKVFDIFSLVSITICKTFFANITAL